MEHELRRPPSHHARIAMAALVESVTDFYTEFFVRRAARRPSVEKAMLKVGSEFGELQDAIFDGLSKQSQEEEWADTMYALYHVALVAGYDVMDALMRVCDKNERKIDTAIVLDGAIISHEKALKRGLLVDERV